MNFEENIEEIITEELGVSEEVKNETSKVINSIANDIVKTIKENNYTPGRLFLTLNRTFVLFGEKIVFGCRCYLYCDSYEIENFKTKKIKEAIFHEGKNPSENWIEINAAFNFETERVEIDYGSVQHEIHHFYQYLKKEKNILKEPFWGTYQRSVARKRNPRHKTDIIVGSILYYATNIERDAIINNFYMVVVRSKPELEMENLKADNHYKDIKFIQNWIDSGGLDPKNKELVNTVSEYNISFQHFCNIARAVVKIYTRNIGRAIIKARQDKEKAGDKQLTFSSDYGHTIEDTMTMLENGTIEKPLLIY